MGTVVSSGVFGVKPKHSPFFSVCVDFLLSPEGKIICMRASGVLEVT